MGLYSTKTCLKVEILEEDTKYSVTVTRSKSYLCFSDGFYGEKRLSFEGIISERSQPKTAPFCSDYNLEYTTAPNIAETPPLIEAFRPRFEASP